MGLSKEKFAIIQGLSKKYLDSIQGLSNLSSVWGYLQFYQNFSLCESDIYSLTNSFPNNTAYVSSNDMGC